jgi:hypothetical protein
MFSNLARLVDGHAEALVAGFAAKAGGAWLAGLRPVAHDPEKACPREGGGCRLFGPDHAHASSMIPKKLAPAKAGVADFSDKNMRKIKEYREHFRFNLIE